MDFASSHRSRQLSEQLAAFIAEAIAPAASAATNERDANPTAASPTTETLKQQARDAGLCHWPVGMHRYDRCVSPTAPPKCI